MREILFRGKRIDNGEWVEGDLVHSYFKVGDTCINASRENLGLYEVDPSTVGQYTGLTANGKKIFEGDIFKFPDEVWESYYTSCGTEYNSWEVENFGVVGFCEYFGRFDFIRYKFSDNSVEADLHENREMEFHEFVCELEVIGTIHDAPELLEVSHE